jgi:hypothetical protein
VRADSGTRFMVVLIPSSNEHALVDHHHLFMFNNFPSHSSITSIGSTKQTPLDSA